VTNRCTRTEKKIVLLTCYRHSSPIPPGDSYDQACFHTDSQGTHALSTSSSQTPNRHPLSIICTRPASVHSVLHLLPHPLLHAKPRLSRKISPALLLRCRPILGCLRLSSSTPAPVPSPLFSSPGFPPSYSSFRPHPPAATDKR
jgi:hypothetical protein